MAFNAILGVGQLGSFELGSASSSGGGTSSSPFGAQLGVNQLGSFELGSASSSGGSSNDLSLIIAGQASITLSPSDIFYNLLTLTSDASITLASTWVGYITQLITAKGSVTSPGGLLLNDNLQIIVQASTTLLSGIAYPETLTLSVISATVEANDYINQLALTLSVTASTSEILEVDFGPTLTISATGTCVVSASFTNNTNLTIGSYAYLYPEGLYNYLNPTAYAESTASPGNALLNSDLAKSVSSVSVSSTIVQNLTVHQTFTITQQAIGRILAKTIFQTYAMYQQVLHGAIRQELISQTLTISQLGREHRDVHTTLSITQHATGIRVKNLTISQKLIIHSTLNRNLIVSRGISQTLLYNPAKGNQQIPIQSSPLVGVITQPLTQAAPHVVTVSKAVVGTGYVALSAPEYTIVLPNPQLNDTQALSGTINLKRTMNGLTWTYKKSTQLNKLKYLFWLGRPKALELRSFLLSYSSVPLTLQNWKGEQWIGAIVNSPFELTSAMRWAYTEERVDITLEFEGVKISG